MKKSIVAIIALLMLCTSFAGTTYAWLVAKTEPLENVFTVGDINIALTQTKPNINKLIPGANIATDPVVTVMADSEDCWLFIKIVKSTEFDDFMEFAIAQGWTPLKSVPDVYYRQVDSSKENQDFSVLDGDTVTVKSSITKQTVDAMSETPRLTFTAFAVQKAGFDDPELAWLQAERLA